jgi:HEAT repeat protein
MVMPGGSGNSQDPPSGEFEQLRGAELLRARELYDAGRAEEGAKILRSLITHSDWAVRSHAVRTVGEVNDPSLLPELCAALADERVEVRESTSRILSWMGTTKELPALRVSANDPAAVVRGHAAAALARIGGIKEQETVKRLLLEDPDPEVRAQVAISLGDIGKREFVDLLCEALADASDVVRSHAAAALGAIGDKSARPALEASRKDPNEYVRRNAEEALRRLGLNGNGD